MIRKLIQLMACSTLLFSAACASVATGDLNSVDSGNNPDDSGVGGSPQGGEFTPDPNDVTITDEGISMRVLWTISGYVLGKGFAGDEQSVKAMLSKPLDINDTQIIFDNQVCHDVVFKEETVNAGEYLAKVWQTTPQELGIEDQEMRVFKTNCSFPGYFQEYMRLGDGRLIVPIHSVFYFFEPAYTQ